MSFPLEKEGARLHGPSFLVVAGGHEPNPQALGDTLPKGDIVIAADGGWRLCRKLRLAPSVLVGDMDTLTPEEVTQAESEGAEIRRYPSDKDQSDLEVAILTAHEMGARRMTLLGALGGQWDHCLANLLAPLSLCQSLGVWARLLTVGAEICLLEPGRYALSAETGTRVSLAALSDQVSGLSLDGFLYPLRGASLARRQTLGLANRIVTSPAVLSLQEGELLVTLVR